MINFLICYPEVIVLVLFAVVMAIPAKDDELK